MKVYELTKTKELTEYDLTKGYLKEDVIIHTLPEQKEQKEEWHYETIAEYANGGKDVKKVIDKPFIPYLPEQEEQEHIQIYVEYTEEELQEMANRKEFAEIEQWFTQYDRVCNEHLRCQRLGIECHHDINEWDKLAVEKANRLKELRRQI